MTMIELAARCLLLGQIEQIRPDLSRPEMLGRFAKVAGEPDDLFDVHTLRVRCQVADLHVLDHATAKRAHGQLLCEMEQRHMAPPHRLADGVVRTRRGGGRSPAKRVPRPIENMSVKSQNYREAV